MNPIVIDLVLALVLALLSAYKKAGTNKTAAFILGLIMGLVPVLNVIGIIYLLVPQPQRNRAQRSRN